MNDSTAAIASATIVTVNKNGASAKKPYKSVPENWKALSEINYQRVISNLESILFEISVDGVNLNSPDGKVGVERLNHWADRLRDTLEALSKGH